MQLQGREKDENSDDELLAMSLLDGEQSAGVDFGKAVRRVVEQYPSCAGLVASSAVQVAALGPGGAPHASAAQFESEALVALVDRIAARKRKPSAEPLRSLLERAEEKFGSVEHLAQRLSIGRSLLVKLNRGLIEAASLPGAFADALAASLSVERAALDAFLSRPPRLSSASDYKSRSRPAPGGRQTFADALATCVQSGEVAAEAAERWQAGAER